MQWHYFYISDCILIKKIPRPATKLGRIIVGGLLVIGGVLGFLPILGFWMIPVGLIILSHDFASVRRFRRNWSVRLGRWWGRFKASRRGTDTDV